MLDGRRSHDSLYVRSPGARRGRGCFSQLDRSRAGNAWQRCLPERKLAHHLPDDPKTVNRAGNLGVPVVLSAPSARIAKALNQLAMLVDGRQKRK